MYTTILLPMRTSILNIDDFLGRINAQNDIIILAHQDLILNSHREVVERSGVVGVRWDDESRFDSLRMGFRQFFEGEEREGRRTMTMPSRILYTTVSMRWDGEEGED